MSKHVSISPAETADRLSVRELVEAYAHCADRDAAGQMALFTVDAHFVVFMDAKDPKPSQELHSRGALAPVFDELNKYAATQHFVGQSTIFTLTSDRATGEAYTMLRAASSVARAIWCSPPERTSTASRTPAASTTAAVNAVAKSPHSAPSARDLRNSSASARSASAPVHARSTRIAGDA
jgi:hypothetical protein